MSRDIFSVKACTKGPLEQNAREMVSPHTSGYLRTTLITNRGLISVDQFGSPSVSPSRIPDNKTGVFPTAIEAHL